MNTLKKIMNEISGDFLSDSNQYLSRYDYLLEHTFTHVGTRSKLLIDLLFSMECSLKSLLFIESNDDEKITYKKAKRCSHNLIKLIDETNKNQVIDNIKHFLISNGIDSIGVTSRYTLEANIQFRESNGILGGKYYSTVADFNWINMVHQKAKELYEYVSNISNAKYGVFVIQNISDIDIDEQMEINSRIRDIAK